MSHEPIASSRVAPAPLASRRPGALEGVRYVLTDMDDTLTFEGKLAAQTYAALERLQRAGIKVVPVTAAPAGWCDQMVRMWPVDAVIGENGGFYSHLEHDDAMRHFWGGDAGLREAADRLHALRESIEGTLGAATIASDQPFRLSTLAWQRPPEPRLADELQQACRAHGADTTVNSLWVLAWFGGFDKLRMTRRLLQEVYAVDIERDRDSVVYVGDSENDAPMFAHFPRSVGVSTVIAHLDKLPVAPRWITNGPGGAGFVEVADAILAAR